jgi:hypothetical protein
MTQTRFRYFNKLLNLDISQNISAVNPVFNNHPRGPQKVVIVQR